MADDDWVGRDLPNVPTFLARVRERPGLWLRTKSARLFHAMMFGIRLAEDFHRVPVGERFGGFDFDAFEAWVAQQYNPRQWSLDSFGLAEELTGSDAAGFDRWFQWYDQFNADPDRG